MNTAASGNNAAAIQSLDDRVTAELASKLDSSALAPAIASCHGGGPGHHGRAGGRARKQHRRAAELADHGALQQGRPVGLRRAGGRGCHQEHPDGVDLKLSNYSTTAAMNGSIASANNATLATVATNYGLKTVVDQHSLDIAARITPLEVDTKVANALLGAITAAALASELQRRLHLGLQASKADASALTAYALFWCLPPVEVRPPWRAGRPARWRPPCRGGRRPGPPW